MWTYPNMGALHSHDHQHHGHGELGGAGLVDTSWNLYCYWLSIELHLLQYQNLIISNHVHLLELSVSAGQQFINPKIIPANVSSNKHALIRLIEYRISILASWQFILFLSGRIINYQKPTLLTQSRKCEWCFFQRKTWLLLFLRSEWFIVHHLRMNFYPCTFGHLNTIEQALRKVKLSHQRDMHMTLLCGGSTVRS